MLRAGRVSGDEGEIDVAGSRAGQLDLRLLGRLAQTLHRHLVGGQIHAGLRLEARDQPVDDLLVEVVAAQTVVTRRSEHFLDAVAHLDDGHVEGAAAEVVHHDLLIGFLVDAVGESRGGGLVDDTLDLETRDLTRVLGRLALCVGEIRGNGDDRLGDGVAEISLCILLELREGHRRDLLRGVGLAVDGDLAVGTHIALNGRDGAIGSGDGLLLRNAADDALAVLLERDDRRGGAGALCVGDDDCLAAFDNGDAGVGRT